MKNKTDVAALLTLQANWFDTLTAKQWEIMINNDVSSFSATNEETPYEQLLPSKNKLLNHEPGFVDFFKAINWVCWPVLGPLTDLLYPLYYNKFVNK